jgi:hypothetical protein
MRRALVGALVAGLGRARVFSIVALFLETVDKASRPQGKLARVACGSWRASPPSGGPVACSSSWRRSTSPSMRVRASSGARSGRGARFSSSTPIQNNRVNGQINFQVWLLELLCLRGLLPQSGGEGGPPALLWLAPRRVGGSRRQPGPQPGPGVRRARGPGRGHAPEGLSRTGRRDLRRRPARHPPGDPVLRGSLPRLSGPRGKPRRARRPLPPEPAAASGGLVVFGVLLLGRAREPRWSRLLARHRVPAGAGRGDRARTAGAGLVVSRSAAGQ